MAVELGPRTYLPPANPLLIGTGIDRPNAADLTAREIDVAARDIVASAFKRASDILRQRRQDLEGGAKLLLDAETVRRRSSPRSGRKRDEVPRLGMNGGARRSFGSRSMPSRAPSGENGGRPAPRR